MSAGSIKVSRDQIDAVNNPMTKSTVRLCGNSHSPVGDGAFGGRKFSGDVFDRRGINPGDLGNVLRSEFGDGVFELIDALGKAAQATKVYSTVFVFKKAIQNRCQQEHVGAGADEVVVGREFRRFGATRVDQDDFAAAFGDVF